jgi:ribosomal protein L7/L12
MIDAMIALLRELPDVAQAKVFSVILTEAQHVVNDVTEYKVVLVASGQDKIGVIKAIRVIMALPLREAKSIVDAGEHNPQDVIICTNRAAAEQAVRMLEAAGAVARIDSK